MSNFLKTAEIRRVLLLKKLARVSRTLSIKRAAAEQLRKYATVARLIREQRMMQKRAEKPAQIPTKSGFGNHPGHWWDQAGTTEGQKTTYESQQNGRSPDLKGDRLKAHNAYRQALNGFRWDDWNTWGPWWNAWTSSSPENYYYYNGKKKR